MIYVYVLTNLVNGNQYVGFAKNPFKRFKVHCGSRFLIGKAIRKYGRENFSIGVINETFKTKKEAGECETRLIAQFNSRTPHGYNLTNGGEGFDSQTSSELTQKRLKNGTFHFQGKQGSELQKRLIQEGKNHFGGKLGSELSKKVQKRRLEDGTHHFQGQKGSELSKKNVRKQIENGKFPIYVGILSKSSIKTYKKWYTSFYWVE